MKPYSKHLREPARSLRKQMTPAEKLLWQRLRRKQIQGVQLYRQKPLLRFIVDFYAPAASLVIEVDGAQHLESIHLEKDAERDRLFSGLGLKVLRFSNQQVFQKLDCVVEEIKQEPDWKLSYSSASPPIARPMVLAPSRKVGNA